MRLYIVYTNPETALSAGMQLEVLVDSPGISIGYDVEKQWLYVDWQGEHDQETTHAACLMLLPSSLFARQAVGNTGHAIEAP